MEQRVLLTDQQPPAIVERDALFSPCRTWRYWLSRIWDRALPCGFVCMLNPSTADAEKDDATIQSLMRRGRLWGWGGFYVANAYGFCSSHPKDLYRAADPIGPANDEHLQLVAEIARTRGGQLVVAWGNSTRWVRLPPAMSPGPLRRDIAVLRLLTVFGAPLHCIGQNDDGSPTHPAARGLHRVPAQTPLQPFSRRTA